MWVDVTFRWFLRSDIELADRFCTVANFGFVSNWHSFSHMVYVYYECISLNLYSLSLSLSNKKGCKYFQLISALFRCADISLNRLGQWKQLYLQLG